MENHHNHKVQNNGGTNNYTCPMHPEVRGNKGDKCPKCGMNLVPREGTEENSVDVSLEAEPEPIEEHQQVKLNFTFSEGNKPVLMEISHEMKVHLMVVNEDLTWFKHIHPEEKKTGLFTVTTIFPFAGKFILFSDFKPQNGSQNIDKKELTVQGKTKSESLEFIPKTVSNVDGYKLILENADHLDSGHSQSLKFSLEKDGKKLSESDLEQYLGASAHIAMIGVKDKNLIHVHPTSNNEYPIYAEAHIKNSGKYRIWVEFQTHGKVHLADFSIEVKEGKTKKGNDEHNVHNH
ncbi:hypothetical protein M3B46_08245 [Sphingobacterium daejeonense]|uniref:heavy metal-binding domain-containing protein n=1 Tax=Sphingobacterium daejeonense TaxID=371142 RepID=UPI0021A37567|nr:heavy metal-binding domain-containing protein [Sphingobacterium daejeonense]MCT1530980.1 hypothetical protein [Sphingobacterium daejeonense]